MVTPHYEWWVGDLRTGKLVRQVDLSDGQWSTDVTGTGTLQGSFPLRSLEWPDVRSDTASPKAFLAVAYIAPDGTETFLEAGPLTPGDFDDTTGVLALGGAGLSSYYNRRKVLPPMAPGANPATQTVSYEAAQLGLIAKRLIELAHTHLGGSMPVVLPDDADLGGAGSTHVRIYPGYELGWVGERLKQLSEVDGGPEYQFVPRRRTDDPRFLEWVMRIGTDDTAGLLTQTGDPWTFDRTVPESPIASIKVAKDTANRTYRSFAAGTGDAEGRLIGWEEDLSEVIENGFALVESEISASDSTECLNTLESLASADLVKNARGYDTWTVHIDRDAKPHVGLLRPGDMCRVRVTGHYYIEDGEHDMRIVRMAGDASKLVELQMAPVVAVD